MNKTDAVRYMDEAKVLLAKTGLVVGIESGRYSEEDLSFKVTLSLPVVSDKGKVLSKEEAEFEKKAKLFGMESDWLFSTVTLRGDSYEIVGLNSRARKYPVILKSKNSGSLYKFSSEEVSSAMGKQPKEDIPTDIEYILKMAKFAPKPESLADGTMPVKKKPLLIPGDDSGFYDCHNEVPSLESETGMLAIAARLANQLSPEVLFADGERSRAEANRFERDILRAWSWLEDKIGRKLNISEFNPDY